MSTAINRNQVQSEEANRMFLELMLINEYLKWVDATNAYTDDEKHRIHNACATFRVINGSQTTIPNVSAIIEGLKAFEADRHAKFVMIMLKQFSEMTFGNNFMKPSEKSILHESMIAINSILGRYSSMFVPARSKATYAKSRMDGTYKAVLGVLKGGIKTITDTMDPAKIIRNMSFIKVLDAIVEKIYKNVLDVPITKCNVPIIDIFVRMVDNHILDNSDLQAKHDIMVVIRFFMMLESIFNEAKMIIENEDLVDSLQEIQDECIPFKHSEIATLTTLGLDAKSFQDGRRAIAGAIKFEDRNTFTKIVIESVILSGYIAHVKQGKVSQTLLEGLRFIAASKHSRLSVIHGLGALAKFLAYAFDFKYVDSVCGYFGLNLQEATLPMNYPDLYGMIYTVDEEAKICYSMAPRVIIDSNLSRGIWYADNVEVFKTLHFDNGYGKVIYDKPTVDEEIKRKHRFIRLAEGYDICATYISEIPKFVEKTTQFKDILHCVLKATIGYPSDFSKRNVCVNGRNETMKATKKFGLEKIVIHNLQTARTASGITQCQSQPIIGQHSYFTLVSPGNGQFSYAHILKPQ